MIRKSLSIWNSLSRYQKSRHLFRIELAVLLILVGLLTFNASVTTGTFLAVEQGFPFGAHGLSVFSVVVATIMIFVRKPTLLRFFFFSSPFLLYAFYSAEASPTPILAVINIILVLFLLTVYWGYIE